MTEHHAYREPARVLSEPAPYLDSSVDCPFCCAMPAMLYFHPDDCPWWRAYVAAGKKMRPRAVGGEMTQEEWAAVLALAPEQEHHKSGGLGTIREWSARYWWIIALVLAAYVTYMAATHRFR